MITLNDVRKAQENAVDAHGAYLTAHQNENAARAAWKAASKPRSLFGDDAAASWRDDPEYVAYKEAGDAANDARAASDAADRYARMVENVFKVQVRQIVGAELARRADEWEGMPAHYKKTLQLLERIANDALKAAGVSDVRAYARNYGTPWGDGWQNDTFISFTIERGTARGVSFKSSDCENVDMQIKGGRLANENFHHWYTTHGRADALELTAADVRRAARRFGDDVERMRAAATRYNDTVNSITGRYRYMGVSDELERERLRRR